MAQLKNTVVNGNFRVNGFMSVGGDLSVNNFSANSITTTTIKNGSNNLLSWANNTITIGITAYNLHLCSDRRPVWKSIDGDHSLATMQDIQSVGNGTLTITQNGANKGTFTANQTNDKTISLTDTWVPNTATADGYVLKGEGSPNKAWMTDERGEPGWRDVILTDKDTTYTLSSKLDQPVLNNPYYIITTKLDGSNDSSSSVKMKFSTSGFDVSLLSNNEFEILNSVKNSWRPITYTDLSADSQTLVFNTFDFSVDNATNFEVKVNEQKFATNTSVDDKLKEVKLNPIGDEMNPVYINANGKPAKAHSFKGLVEASVANNVLTLTIL